MDRKTLRQVASMLAGYVSTSDNEDAEYFDGTPVEAKDVSTSSGGSQIVPTLSTSRRAHKDTKKRKKKRSVDVEGIREGTISVAGRATGRSVVGIRGERASRKSGPQWLVGDVPGVRGIGLVDTASHRVGSGRRAEEVHGSWKRKARRLIEYKRERHVRTPEGMRKYNLPLGALIEREPELPHGVTRAPRTPRTVTPKKDKMDLRDYRAINSREKFGTWFAKRYGPTRGWKHRDTNFGPVWQKESKSGYVLHIGPDEGGVVFAVKPPGSDSYSNDIRAYARNSSPNDWPLLSQVLDKYEDFFDDKQTVRGLKRKKNTSIFHDDDGIRGEEWQYEGDEDLSPEEIIGDEANELGYQFMGNWPNESAAFINSQFRAYDNMYPGFTRTQILALIMDTPGRGGPQGPAISSNAFADCAATFMGIPRARIRFNSKFWDENHWEDGVDAKRRGGDINWHSVSMSELEQQEMGQNYPDWQLAIAATLHHEVGHTIWPLVFQSPSLSKKWTDLQLKYNVANMREVTGITTKLFDKNTINVFLSEYGATNDHEFAAECWAEYMLSDNPRQFALDFADILEEALVNRLEAKTQNT